MDEDDNRQFCSFYYEEPYFLNAKMMKEKLLIKGARFNASDFFQTFRDFGIRRKLIFFSLSLVNFAAEICTVMKM